MNQDSSPESSKGSEGVEQSEGIEESEETDAGGPRADAGGGPADTTGGPPADAGASVADAGRSVTDADGNALLNPGWYPDPAYAGYVRYWDGGTWGERTPGEAASAGAGNVGAGSPAAGWYPDPESAGHVRYWDGGMWGERTPGPAAAAGTGDAGAGSAPAGWYPDPDLAGQVRYWDGARWGQRAAGPGAAQQFQQASNVSDERTMAILAHVLGIVTGFIGPLIIYLIAKPEQPFAKHHAAEALNFQLTLLIAWLVTIIASILIIGLLFIPVLIVAGIVFPILAAVAANRGEWYRYPINIRMVGGAQG